MKTKQVLATGTVAMLMALGTAASAQEVGQEIIATLEQTEGVVLVNQGEEFVIAQRSIPLYPNNRILTRSAAKALVKYPDGCVIEMPELSLLTIKNAEECTKGAALLSDSGALGADPSAVGAAAGGTAAGTAGAGAVGGSIGGGVGLGTIAAGVAGGVGLVGAVVVSNDNNNDDDNNERQISPAR